MINMKKIFFILSIVLLPTTLWASNGKQAILETAAAGDEQYRLGNYDSAAKYYSKVLEANYASADLYYNLGNAYYRTGQIGLAILNYERALRLQPSMSDARENLELANSKTVDRITPLPRFFLVNWYNALITRLTPHTWRILLCLFFLLAGASLALLLLARSITIKKISLATLILSAGLFLIALFFLIKSTNFFNSHNEAVILDASVTVKSSPELQSVDKLILHEGTKVTISESLAGWHKITLADGTSGWCQSNLLEKI